MDTKVKGIILKLTDYKEADKLASIFSLEQGIITANFRGVKKEKSKLKSSCMPFTFAEFNINKTGATRTVTSVNVLDGFYGLTMDYNKTIFGYIVLDIIKTILPPEKQEPDLFVITLNALKQIETEQPCEALVSFIIKFIDFSGMTLNFDHTNIVYLDRTTGEFVSSANFATMQIDKKVYSFLKSVALNQQGETYSDTIKKQALRLLNLILKCKFNAKIKAFEFV